MVLFIEDSDTDYELIELGVRRTEPKMDVVRAIDGTNAAQFVRQSRQAGVRPTMMVFDIQLQSENGLDLLTQFRRDEDLATIPMLVFSACSSDHEKHLAFERGANGFYVKPVDAEEFLSTVERMVRHWAGGPRTMSV